MLSGVKSALITVYLFISLHFRDRQRRNNVHYKHIEIYQHWDE